VLCSTATADQTVDMTVLRFGKLVELAVQRLSGPRPDGRPLSTKYRAPPATAAAVLPQFQTAFILSPPLSAFLAPGRH
jgi:hypothetical protein